ncbi:hypothetical protein [Paenibacillus glucanolyticus]|uniref:hypothetical protein n=1 Tax=Paenibacillus glucanolyticus TaxID=59843 RepID=UPI00096D9F23|nr:hypothetical protein [Paenibacillus glucanolyticus]OMF70489.1 hypothetical protein BK142_23740 [Paenibacillus glucanolyticus]
MNNQVKLIDADKLRIWLAKRMHHPRIYGDPFKCVLDAMLNGEFDPDTPPVPTIKPGDGVRHEIYGNGIVMSDVVTRTTVEVDFDLNTFTVPVGELEEVE